MCLEIKFLSKEWDEETKEVFIEGLARMTADYLKSKQDYGQKQSTKYETRSMADLDG